MKKFIEIVRGDCRCSRDYTSILLGKSSRKAFAVALLILAMAGTPGLARAESVVGKVSSVNGTVQIVRDGKTLIATNGMAIRLHDKVVTGENGSVTIVMRDHSLLHLDRSGSFIVGKVF